MARRIKDYVEIREYRSLDDLIRALVTLRNRIPADAEPEMKVRGDDFFGRTLTISYFRELTVEEAALERRYQFSFQGGKSEIKMVA